MENYVVRCAACGTRNRIPAEKIGSDGKCGKCGTILATDGVLIDHTITVTDADFNAQVVRSPLPVVVDCWAPWCGPCKMIGPVMDQLAKEWRGQVRVCKLNVDENQTVATQFQIRSIPTILIFDGGGLRETLVGALPKKQIVQKVAPYLAAP